MAQRTITQSESPSPVLTTDSRPVPDPTVLTTQQLAAAINGQRDLFEVRFNAMDKAVDLLQSQANKSPTIGEVYAKFEERFASIAHQMEGMAEISEQRFIRIDSSFIERDKRTDQLTLASSTAIAAALQAQKEAAGETQKSSSLAITKSETATVESIKQLQTLFQTSIAGLSTQILDVKSRLDKGEGQGTGASIERADARVQVQDSRGMVFGVAGISVAIATIIITFITHMAK